MKFFAGFVLLLAIGARAQILETAVYATTGHPTDTVTTPDGTSILVTVNRKDGSGLDVFHDFSGKLERVGFQSLGAEGAQGILLIPHTRMLAVGVSNAGVAFLPLDEALTGTAKPMILPQGEKSGSGYLAVTPDGQFLFVANEYGEDGNLGVIALHPDKSGGVHPETVVQIPTAHTTPGVTISPDGSRVYTVGETSAFDASVKLGGHENKDLRGEGCVAGHPDKTNPTGVLYTIDVAKVRALSKDASPEQIAKVRIAAENSGCSPVREVVSEDGKTVFVTARSSNRVLVFDAKALESDMDHALLSSIDTHGEAPVGLKLFAGGKRLVVANSNRYAGGPGNVAVLDLANTTKPMLRQIIATGAFPRNINSSPDGKTLYITIFNGDQLIVLKDKQ